MIHKLKTDSEVFYAVMSGDKTFEIRKNDRNFEVGDILDLREIVYTEVEIAAGHPVEYTGRSYIVRVDYILRGPIYGLMDGWCIMSITA